MVKPNIGIVNALVRITCGFTTISWATAKLTRQPWRSDSYLMMAMLGGMKIAEGITRFCPMTYMFEQFSKEQCSQEQTKQKMQGSMYSTNFPPES
ncbi:DUF2892 domain-containing protein [Bacillus sp. HMF5848]|uniref:YgaP family membrane protein n=1 Tax=Bacillus sp. HMF5848 TaxID=2495421 RepID=UPI000F795148|nr:DUF2892 domain-containing protein [Bacillus sp. HMF5848]RSK25757.1 DUF2892 domain-containing protein [Bacillus sp. HMF5848]